MKLKQIKQEAEIKGDIDFWCKILSSLPRNSILALNLRLGIGTGIKESIKDQIEDIAHIIVKMQDDQRGFREIAFLLERAQKSVNDRYSEKY